MGKFGIKNIWDIKSGSNVDTSNLVTTNTNQTISGDKQFNSNIQVKKILELINQTNDNIWANFECDNQNLTISTNNNVNIDIKNKKILNVSTPTSNNDCANKQYVDNNKYGDSFTKIKSNQNSIGILGDNWTLVQDYTNNENNFTIVNGGVYEVMFKCNISNQDIYCSCVLSSNSANYDNCGFSSVMYWVDNGATPNTSTVKFAIYLKNNQYKLFAKRAEGSTNQTWIAQTTIFVRKIGQNSTY